MDDDDHPLLVELDSLRQTAARFQASHEAHAAAIKLQRHSLDALRIHERAAALEQENVRLTHEIDILRTHPDVPLHPAVTQVQELTLALRRVSDKIVLTESALLERTSELTQTRSEIVRARHIADGAYELAARVRAREEASKAHERELEFKVRASEEERKMADLVVQEYADLVRNLEGRKSVNHTPLITNGSVSTTTPIDSLQDGKSNLHRMLTAFSTESENLHATITELNTKVSTLQMTLDAERLTASNDRTLLSQTKAELDKLNLEDQTAAKMVARYMKFSQATTNSLQQQITTLKTRHASMIATLELQLSIVESQLASERTRTARLQDALDELCEDLARESYGRRREVSLRLALLSREEGIAELMRRWARRARELYARCYSLAESPSPRVPIKDTVQGAFYRVVTDAETLLSTLDDDMQFSDATCLSGSLARIVLSRAAVDALRSELQDEVLRRVEAVRKSAFSFPNGHPDETASGGEDLARLENTPSQENDRDPDRLLLTPNGNAGPNQGVSPTELPKHQDIESPVSMVGTPEETVDDPFVVPVPSPVALSAAEITEHATVEEVPSLSVQDSSITLFVEDKPNAVQLASPAVSMLNFQEDFKGHRAGEPQTIDIAPICALLGDIPVSDDTIIPSTSISVPTSIATLEPPIPVDTTPTLLSELGATKHRYDDLQRAFRDCSLALKELKHTIVSSFPSPHTQTKFRQHLETALSRIDDYAEDARVELEIRVADEELAMRGFEMVLSVPSALVDADERAEMETNARAFVDGTDDGVARALEKFGKRLEDVQHDVAVVKRAVHGLAMLEGEEGEEANKNTDGGKDAGTGAGWTAWTAGLLGANTMSPRSPTPVQTFGEVMTSPRLRHATSHENTPDHGPLAGLNLRIPMPSPSPSHAPWTHLGLGRATDGEARPRTLSMMYAVGGLQSSSFRLGVGFSGSPSPARSRSVTALGMGLGGAASPLRAGVNGATRHDTDDMDTQGTMQVVGEVHDLGGVE